MPEPVQKDTRRVIADFWAAMATNDFTHAAGWLTEDAEIHWPQSREIIRGRANFAALNAAYPAVGRWRFDIHRILAEGDQAAYDITVRDDRLTARVVGFATVKGGLISRAVEYWPEDYPAPAWRAAWVLPETPPG